MTERSFGKKQYIAVEGLDKALKLLRTMAEVNPEHQFLLQLDDCDIWIISWADHCFDYGGERFVHMTEGEYDRYTDKLEDDE